MYLFGGKHIKQIPSLPTSWILARNDIIRGLNHIHAVINITMTS